MVIESLAHALDRGAEIVAEVAGYGATSDAYHLVRPCEDGDGAARAIRLALEDAGLNPNDIDHVNVHRTSTQLNDAAETTAIKRALGEAAYRVSVSSTKSMIGRSTRSHLRLPSWSYRPFPVALRPTYIARTSTPL